MSKAKRIAEWILIGLFIAILASFASIQIYRSVVNSDWYIEKQDRKNLEQKIESVNDVDNIKYKDLNSFLLGNTYPDCWITSTEKSLGYHYKDDISSLCDLERFKRTEKMDNFNFGYYFHLWVDNRILEVDVGDISKYDCLICDMAVITPIIHQLKQLTVTDKKLQALQNIMALESEPMPLYLVSEDKKKRYEEILDMLIDEFIKGNELWHTE